MQMMKTRPAHARARRILASLAVGGWLVWGSLGALPAQAACRLQQLSLPVHMVDKRPISTLTINGTELPMLVDSGAFFSVLSDATATQLNLPLRSVPFEMRITGFAGDLKTRLTTVDKLGLKGAELPRVDFLVGANEIGHGIMGIMGRNILSATDADYDLAHGVVHLTFPTGECEKTNLAHWAGDAPVIELPLERLPRSVDQPILVEVKANGKTMVALLDTGAPRSVMTLRSARRAGIDESDLTSKGRTSGAGAGIVKLWRGPLKLLEVGGETLRDNEIEIADSPRLDYDLILGMDYFLSHRIYVSRLQRKVYATWNGRPVFEDGPGDGAGYDQRYAATSAEVDATDADALARRGTALLAAGDLAKAQADLDRACELAPDRADFRFALARLQLARKAVPAAIVDLNEVLRLDPALHEARLLRAQLRERQRDPAGAEEDLAVLDAQLPPSAHQRAAMGSLYASHDRWPEASRQFDQWIASHPQDVQRAHVLDQRCWLRLRLGGDPSLAWTDCDKAVDLDDQVASYQEHLGWSLLRLDRARKARSAFDKALQLSPKRASALYGRGLALRKLDDEPAALADIEAAQRLEPAVLAQLTRHGLTGDATSAPARAQP